MQMWMRAVKPRSHNPSYTPPPPPRLLNMTLNPVTNEKLASKKPCATTTIPTCPGTVSRIRVERHQDDAPRSPHALSGVMITRAGPLLAVSAAEIFRAASKRLAIVHLISARMCFRASEKGPC